MPGIEHTDGWTVLFLFLFIFVVPFLLIAVVFVGAGGGIYWAVKRTLPPSRAVRVCMVVGAVLVVLGLGFWIADGAKLPAHITGMGLPST